MKHLSKLFAASLWIGMAGLASCSHDAGTKAELDCLPVKMGSKWGYVDLQGKYVTNPVYKDADLFYDGLGRMEDEQGYGYVGRDGKTVIAPRYAEATRFGDGLAWTVLPDSAPSVIDREGNVKFTFRKASVALAYSEGLSFVRLQGGKEIALDTDGKTVFTLPEGLISWGDFHDGLALVYNGNDKYGYVDKEGRLAIPCQFDKARSFRDGHAIVKQGGRWGVIGRDGQYVINPQFDELNTDGDRYMVVAGRRVGWCDKEGKIIINPQFDMSFGFHGSALAPVQQGGSFGYADKEGKLVINPQFQVASPFLDGSHAVVVFEGKYGMIDAEGKYVANPQFDDVKTPPFWDESSRDADVSVSTQYTDVDEAVKWTVDLLKDNCVDGMKLSETGIKDFEKHFELGGEVQGAFVEICDGISAWIHPYGNFYREVSDGWWGTEQQYVPSAPVRFVEIEFEISKPGKNLRESLYAKLVSALGGYDGRRSSGQHVRVYGNPSKVSVQASDQPLGVSEGDPGWVGD